MADKLAIEVDVELNLPFRARPDERDAPSAVGRAMREMEEQYAKFFATLEAHVRANDGKFEQRRSKLVSLKDPGDTTARKGFDGHWFVPTFVQGLGYFGTAAGMLAFLKLCKDPLVAWIKARGNTAIKVKIHDREVHIKGAKDIDAALRLLEKLEAPGTLNTKARKKAAGTKQSTSKKQGRKTNRKKARR